jgi:putative transposase
MSYPRRVLPGSTVMITRRTVRRTKLLRPDRELDNLYLYCLAVASEKFGIAVHCATVMSNHHHLVVTDTRGELPNFLRELHRNIALGVKVLRKWEGTVWDGDKPSVVLLRTDQAVAEKIGYCIANPVTAGGVPRARLWPGICVQPQQLGRWSWTGKRPDAFFDPRNPQWPEVATLELTMPSVALTDALLRENVALEVAHLEAEAHRLAEAKGWKFLGAAKVLAASPYDRATSWEPLRSRNPTFAVGRGQREAFIEAVTILRDFRRSYRAALNAWRAAVRDVLFPAGTWFMRWGHNASVAPS